MSDNEYPEEYMFEEPWCSNTTLFLIFFTLVAMFVSFMFAVNSQQDRDDIIIEKSNGPYSPLPLPTPKGMNGPSEKQVIGRGR